MGHAVAQLVEARKVAGSILKGVIGIFHWHTPSDRTAALSTRGISWRVRRPMRKSDKLPLSCADCLEIWEPQPPGTPRVCPGIVLSLPVTLIMVRYYIIWRHYESRMILSMLRLWWHITSNLSPTEIFHNCWLRNDISHTICNKRFACTATTQNFYYAVQSTFYRSISFYILTALFY